MSYFAKTRRAGRLSKKQVDKLVELIRGKILARFPEVSFAYLYGSALSARTKEETVPPPEDIDVSVYLTEGDPVKTELEMQMQFHELTGLPPEVLDVRSLNNAPLSVAIEIITKGELIFCRNEVIHNDFLEEVSNKYRQLRGLIEVAYGWAGY